MKHQYDACHLCGRDVRCYHQRRERSLPSQVGAMVRPRCFVLLLLLLSSFPQGAETADTSDILPDHQLRATGMSDDGRSSINDGTFKTLSKVDPDRVKDGDTRQSEIYGNHQAKYLRIFSVFQRETMTQSEKDGFGVMDRKVEQNVGGVVPLSQNAGNKLKGGGRYLRETGADESKKNQAEKTPEQKKRARKERRIARERCRAEHEKKRAFRKCIKDQMKQFWKNERYQANLENDPKKIIGGTNPELPEGGLGPGQPGSYRCLLKGIPYNKWDACKSQECVGPKAKTCRGENGVKAICQLTLHCPSISNPKGSLRSSLFLPP